jgi:hypothetical protein
MGSCKKPITRQPEAQPAVRKGRRTRGNRLKKVVAKKAPRGGEEISPYQLVGPIVPQNDAHVQTLLDLSEFYLMWMQMRKKATENRPGRDKSEKISG